ncbi:hypothetical protein [Nocardia salmonicida]|uniref:hypothetical protein n=1 Tax=Nocardia salmonicida TaxID=53431 RepID=UPI00363F1EF6
MTKKDSAISRRSVRVAILASILIMTSCGSMNSPGATVLDAFRSDEDIVSTALARTSRVDTVLIHQVLGELDGHPAAEMDIRVSRQSGQLYATGSMFGGPIELLLTRDGRLSKISAMNTPAMREIYPTMTENTWFKMPRDGDLFADLMASIAQDPTVLMGLESASVTEAVKMGTSDVDGVAVVRYSVKYNPQKYGAELVSRYPVLKNEPDYERKVLDVVPVEVTISVDPGRGLVIVAEGRNQLSKYVNYFSAFDKPVSIPAPADADVIVTPLPR